MSLEELCLISIAPDLDSTPKKDAEQMIKLLENWDGSFAEKSIQATVYSYW